MTSTLDCLGYTTLELQRGSCDTTGKDLTLLVQKLLEELRILIVDILDAAALETAVLFLLNVYRQRSQIADF